MKIKNKGKVYPSSDSSSSSQSPTCSNKEKEKDFLSILKLLPAAILTLISVLSLHDKEVLAYMITHSMKTTLIEESKKKPSSSKKIIPSSHKTCPFFDCDCFDCYTSYWQKWNNSPNHQVIQQAIEAFEDHLSKDEKSRKSNSRSRKSKNSRKLAGKSVLDNTGNLESDFLDISTSKNQESSCLEDVNVLSSNDDMALDVILENEGKVEELGGDVAVVKEEVRATGMSPAAVNSRKGIARKVLPDVLGILNSRLWNLWGPNV